MNESDYPALYIATDETSNIYQRRFLFSFGLNIWCLVMSAMLSVIDFEDTNFALVQGLLLLLGLASSTYLAVANSQQIWYGNRALAESIKTLSWRYMMRAEPYDGSDAEAQSHFLKSIRKIFESNKQASEHAIPHPDASQVTTQMRSVRALIREDRSEFYLKNRISDQLAWYTKKARFNRHKAWLWYSAICLCYTAAIVFSFSKIQHIGAKHWPTDLLTAMAGGILAWIQTKRFQELSASYALTAHEIGIVGAELPISADEASFSVFVSDAENAFSREHTQWQARRDRD